MFLFYYYLYFYFVFCFAFVARCCFRASYCSRALSCQNALFDCVCTRIMLAHVSVLCVLFLFTCAFYFVFCFTFSYYYFAFVVVRSPHAPPALELPPALRPFSVSSFSRDPPPITLPSLSSCSHARAHARVCVPDTYLCV